MARPHLSIRDILVLIVGALTVMIAFLAGRETYGDWLRLDSIRALEQASNFSDQIFAATENLGVERDVALSILSAPDLQTRNELSARLQPSRQGANAALQATLAELARLPVSELTGQQETIAAHLATIESLRPVIDREAGLPREARDRNAALHWSEQMTATMQETNNLWIEFVRQFADIDPGVTQNLWLLHFLQVVSDHAGRERSLIGQLIDENAPPTSAQAADFLRWQGIIEQSWQMSRLLAEQSSIFAEIEPYYTDAQSHYATVNAIMRSIIGTTGVDGEVAYPIGIDLWFEMTMQASDSFALLRLAAMDGASENVERLIIATENEIKTQSVIFAVAFVLCLYCFWIIMWRVIRPINEMVEALLSATRGETITFTDVVSSDDEIGKLAEVLHAFQENLEHVRHTAAELNRSQRRLNAIVDYARDALITTDSDGRITTFNPAGEQMWGYSANEIIGKPITVLLPGGEWSADYDECHDDTGRNHVREVVARRRGGGKFPISLSVSAYSLDNQHHFSGIVRDISARKQVEIELAAYTRKLERSNKELDDFAYIASHDLKEPLRGIHNHSRFLLEDNEDKLDDDSTNRLNRLVYLSQRMERLVNDLLYFSRLGRQELAVQATDIGAVIEDVGDTLETFFEERGARIVIPSELPTIICDKPRVAELFRNLITNAVKYNDKPAKTVEIGFLEAKSMPDGVVATNVFYVKDNGVGIPPEFHTEVFRIFKRLQTERTPEDGTGVGLTFVKKIVERHGGAIWLESAMGAGTTFYFTLEALLDDARPSSKAA